MRKICGNMQKYFERESYGKWELNLIEDYQIDKPEIRIDVDPDFS